MSSGYSQPDPEQDETLASNPRAPDKPTIPTSRRMSRAYHRARPSRNRDEGSKARGTRVYTSAMSRREETRQLTLPGLAESVSSCASPAGASPAPVSAGAPGSRPQQRGEILEATAGCQEPLRREQERGPQHEVNPAASTEKPRGSARVDETRVSRAAHATAKAMPVAPESGDVCATGPSGVRGAARVQGDARNTGDPSAPPSSGSGASNKPKVKSSTAQRESDGVTVPSMVAQNNAT